MTREAEIQQRWTAPGINETIHIGGDLIHRAINLAGHDCTFGCRVTSDSLAQIVLDKSGATTDLSWCLERIDKLEALANELLEEYVDACWQGTGNEPLAYPGWHNCLSTYETANELIPRARALLEAQ